MPNTNATSSTIMPFGETGASSVIAGVNIRVLLIVTLARISFSSRFCNR